MNIFPLFNKDAYKIGHLNQYPDNTEFVYSNLTPRGDRLAPFDTNSQFYNKEVVFVGLQMFVKDILIDQWNELFFSKSKEYVVKKYSNLINSMGLGIDVSHIGELHDVGYLPIRIKALPEGAKIPMKVPVMTITNTDKRFGWLVNVLETSISAETWKLITSATIANQYKQLFLSFAEKTGVHKDFCDIQGHDFSARGMSGMQDAAKTGIGHLSSFIGTDTLAAVDAAEQFYNMDLTKDLVGVSVPATEHAVMMLGQKESELDTYRRLINEVYPTGIISIVSDTWDYWKLLTDGVKELKQDILSRSPDTLGNCKVVFRPDSGDPIRIISGYLDSEIIDIDTNGEDYIGYHKSQIVDLLISQGKRYELLKMNDQYWKFNTIEESVSLSEVKGSVQVLWDEFGGTITEKGFKELDSHVGLIYGDSITFDRARKILEILFEKGFASSNIVFGIGSYTYQYITRDSFGMAIKATNGIVDGNSIAIFKDPKTDTGDKKSAKGLMRVELENSKYVMYDEQTIEQEKGGELKVVFENSVLYNQTSLTDIRARLNT